MTSEFIEHIFYVTSSSVKFCASFRSHQWIQTRVTARKRPFASKSAIFLSRVTMEFGRWPWKTIEHLFLATSSFVHHFITICGFKLELLSETPNLGQNRLFFAPCDLEIWWMTLKTNRAPLVCYFRFCASFHCHWWIQSYSPETPGKFGSKLEIFFVPCGLEIWRTTLKNNRASLLCHIKLSALFHCHMWTQTGVTVRKLITWVFDLCDLDLRPLTLTFCMDITFVNGNHFWKFHDDTMRETL